VIVATRVTGKRLKQLVDEEALSATELCDLLRETGAIYGKLHQISTDGFGHLDAQGKGQRKDWYAAHLGNLDLKRLRQSSDNAGLPWSLVEEGLKLGKKNAGLGDGIAPCLQQGDFKLEHIIVDQGHVSGLIDFEYCRGDDPADEAGWSGELNQGSWWDAFTGETSSAFPTQPLVEGYRQTGTIDAGFQTRRHWLNFCHGLGGLCYHGINDINTAGMMDFLHWRYREDLAITKRHLS
jgi:aminoglycoside phosphotransferase (APT) family kinase protein